MRPSDRYTYENAGFNNFLLRSLKSNPSARTVKAGVSPGAGGNIAFDRMHIGGSIGDTVTFGRIAVDGAHGNLLFHDERGTEAAILGFD